MDILWWHWLVLGLLLVVVELVSAGGFYIIFFGVGALIVGLLSASGAAGPGWAPSERRFGPLPRRQLVLGRLSPPRSPFLSLTADPQFAAHHAVYSADSRNPG